MVIRITLQAVVAAHPSNKGSRENDALSSYLLVGRILLRHYACNVYIFTYIWFSLIDVQQVM